MAILRGTGDEQLHPVPVQRLQQDLHLEVLLSPACEGRVWEPAEGQVQELRPTVPLAGLPEETPEVRVRRRTEVHVFRLWQEVPAQAAADISLEEVPLIRSDHLRDPLYNIRAMSPLSVDLIKKLADEATSPSVSLATVYL